MFKRMIALMSVLCVLVFAANARAEATLKVGDPAPALSVGKWVKGEPVAAIEEGKIYVVEFWATWCGPCVKTIPHVSKLQQKYADVVFIGQNVWERDESKVAPFVEKMGDQMNYRVVMDDKSADEDGAMATTWMRAAGQNGIPAAFIVGKDKKIQWIGHPAQMDKPLEQIVAGTYDAEAAAKEAEQANAAKGKMADLQKQLQAALQAKDYDKMASIMDEIAVAMPAAKLQIMASKYMIFSQLKQDKEAAAKAGDAFYEAAKDDAGALNELAYSLVSDEGRVEVRDNDFAEKLALRANEITKSEDPAILDTVAAVYAAKTEYAKAVEWQTKAVEKADGEMKSDLQKTLDKYKAKADEKK
jgi:thiol-disulfide isomerase/thioredoxin